MSIENHPHFDQFRARDGQLRESFIETFRRIEANSYGSPGLGRELVQRFRDLIEWEPRRRYETDRQRYVAYANQIASVMANEQAFISGTLGKSEWSDFADGVDALSRESLPLERDWTTGPVVNRFHDLFGTSFDLDGAVREALRRGGVDEPDGTTYWNVFSRLQELILSECEAMGSSAHLPVVAALRKISRDLMSRDSFVAEHHIDFLSYLGQPGALWMAKLLIVRDQMIDDAAQHASEETHNEHPPVSLVEVESIASTEADRLRAENLPFGSLGSYVENRTREVKSGFLGRTKTESYVATIPLVVQGWPLGVVREAIRSNGTSSKARHVVLCEDGVLGVAVVTDNRAEIVHRGSFAALQVLMHQNPTWAHADEHTSIADYPSEYSLELENALVALVGLCRRIGT